MYYTFQAPELGSTELWINGEFGVREERLASSPRKWRQCLSHEWCGGGFGASANAPSSLSSYVSQTGRRRRPIPAPTTMDRAIDPSKPLCAATATATTSRRQPLSIRPIRPSVQRSAVASFAGAFCLWTQHRSSKFNQHRRQAGAAAHATSTYCSYSHRRACLMLVLAVPVMRRQRHVAVGPAHPLV
jgi:hypothetical protein